MNWYEYCSKLFVEDEEEDDNFRSPIAPTNLNGH